jgi:hypothetical protein
MTRPADMGRGLSPSLTIRFRDGDSRLSRGERHRPPGVEERSPGGRGCVQRSASIASASVVAHARRSMSWVA